MKLTIFGSQTCDKCKLLCNCLYLIKIPFHFVDAMADDTQEICDKHDVAALPHVIVMDDEGNVVWEKAKDVSLDDILVQMKINNEVK